MKCKYSDVVFVFASLLLFYSICGDSEGSTGNQTNKIQCIAKERDALLQFKQGVEVDHCGLLTSWVGQECCQWHGIRCSNHSSHVISLDVSGFQNYNPYSYFFCIEGTVSPSLVELEHLQHLDLSYNNFQSQPIPSFIGSLLNLNYLNLSNCNFAGEVPHQLANLSSLTSLDLSNDYDNGDLSVKSLRWLSHLTLLTYINLSFADLSVATDWMQIINNLPLLKNLHMDACQLSMSSSLLEYTNSSTTLHTLSLQTNFFQDTNIFEWVSNLTRLSSTFTYLDLFSNHLSGPIPSSFSNMHSLLHLNLSANDFKGPIPERISALKNLVHLDLSFNRFEGPIPETFSNLKNLVHLDLSFNNFQGSKWNPEVLGSLCSLLMLSLARNNITNELSTIIQPLFQCVHRSLVSLDIHHNRLWGSLPDEIGTFSSLRELDLNDNQLNGRISLSLGQLSMLETLDLSSNSLKGTISNQHLSNLSRLTVLDLSDNPKLMFNISVNVVPPFQLDVIHLRFCKLGPIFPKWLLTQTNFSSLDVSNANISDTIPAVFWSSLPFNLINLDMSGNMIHGNIPDVPISFHNPLRIDLSSNLLHGAIPSFLRNASALFLNDNNFSDCGSFFRPRTKVVLSVLSLSNNKLSGTLPSSWGYFDQLFAIYLDRNNFSGSLPNSIGTLTQLEALHLRKNNISGELPIALQKCRSLIMLDLSYNSITGSLPNLFGNVFNKLTFLNLRSNNFRGGLPLSLCQMSNLQILDLSTNSFLGFIPNCIRNLTAMLSYLDSPTISINGLYGGIYDSAWIMWKREGSTFQSTLGLVKAIDLSNNELEGPIPDGISSLVGLQSLDLSRNRLNGSITPNISQLTSLEYLDLSRNQLSGEIPSSLSTLSSLGTLDVSFNNLYGRIPLGTQLQSFNASSYIGNSRLCGKPLLGCPGDPTPANSPKEDKSSHQDDELEYDDDDNNFFLGLYISVVLGFIVGFWGICGSLVIKRSWRQAFFGFSYDINDKLYEFFVVNKARVLRRNT